MTDCKECERLKQAIRDHCEAVRQDIREMDDRMKQRYRWLFAWWGVVIGAAVAAWLWSAA